MARNERTSKRVASMAGKLLRQQAVLEREFRKFIALSTAVAASALTQARDRK